jgi:carbon storage regulator
MIRRRSGESIFVGEDIEVQVLEVAGNRVKLGILAPRNVLVLRNELKLTEDFNREASRGVASASVVSLAAALQKSRAGS